MNLYWFLAGGAVWFLCMLFIWFVFFAGSSVSEDENE